MEYLPSKFFSIYPYIVQTNGFDILEHCVFGGVVKRAVGNGDAGNWNRGVAAHKNSVLAFFTGDIGDIDVPYDGTERPAFAFFVKEVDFDDGFGDLANRNIPKTNVFDCAAAV